MCHESVALNFQQDLLKNCAPELIDLLDFKLLPCGLVIFININTNIYTYVIKAGESLKERYAIALTLFWKNVTFFQKPKVEIRMEHDPGCKTRVTYTKH